jgi:hypothetical protein
MGPIKRAWFWLTVPYMFVRGFFGWRRHYTCHWREDAVLAWRDATGVPADGPAR